MWCIYRCVSKKLHTLNPTHSKVRIQKSNIYLVFSIVYYYFLFRSVCKYRECLFPSSVQFYLSYHLYIVACAGAGAAVIAMVSVNAGVYWPVLSRWPSPSGAPLFFPHHCTETEQVSRTEQWPDKQALRFIYSDSHYLFHFFLFFPQFIYMMATTYNFALLKFKSREDCCTKL